MNHVVSDFGNVVGNNMGDISAVIHRNVVDINGKTDASTNDVGAVNDIQKEHAKLRRSKSRASSDAASGDDGSGVNAIHADSSRQSISAERKAQKLYGVAMLSGSSLDVAMRYHLESLDQVKERLSEELT